MTSPKICEVILYYNFILLYYKHKYKYRLIPTAVENKRGDEIYSILQIFLL